MVTGIEGARAMRWRVPKGRSASLTIASGCPKIARKSIAISGPMLEAPQAVSKARRDLQDSLVAL
jgi:hypothetical protein